MTYSCEEFDGQYITLYSKPSEIYKILLLSQMNWETSEMKNERIPYMGVGSSFEIKGDHDEICSSRK